MQSIGCLRGKLALAPARIPDDDIFAAITRYLEENPFTEQQLVDAVARVVDGAPEEFNTMAKIAAWITAHKPYETRVQDIETAVAAANERTAEIKAAETQDDYTINGTVVNLNVDGNYVKSVVKNGWAELDIGVTLLPRQANGRGVVIATISDETANKIGKFEKYFDAITTKFKVVRLKWNTLNGKREITYEGANDNIDDGEGIQYCVTFPTI